ncbi:MAG: class IV adenylate cyclase [Bacteroidota bacterium]
MPRNLELKAPLPSLRTGAAIARSLRARNKGLLYHIDTYFTFPVGRLKLREFRDGHGELISYARSDRKGARISRYTIMLVRYPREIRKVLRRLFGVQVVVRKRRRLYTMKNARIHLDQVSGLGSFVEFEVIVRYGLPQAKRLMNVLKTAFSVRDRDCIGTSYSTMLINRSR